MLCNQVPMSQYEDNVPTISHIRKLESAGGGRGITVLWYATREFALRLKGTGQGASSSGAMLKNPACGAGQRQLRKGDSSGITIPEGFGSMAGWALDGRPLPWPLHTRQAGELRGVRAGEIGSTTRNTLFL